MDGHRGGGRNEEPWRPKVYMPQDETKASGEMSVGFEVDLACLVRQYAPNWGNQSWKEIPTNQKKALFKKIEVVYFYPIRYYFVLICFHCIS